MPVPSPRSSKTSQCSVCLARIFHSKIVVRRQTPSVQCLSSFPPTHLISTASVCCSVWSALCRSAWNPRRSLDSQRWCCLIYAMQPFPFLYPSCSPEQVPRLFLSIEISPASLFETLLSWLIFLIDNLRLNLFNTIKLVLHSSYNFDQTVVFMSNLSYEQQQIILSLSVPHGVLGFWGDRKSVV